MTTAAPGEMSLTPFLSGGPKRLLIGGRWVEASSGATFSSINPSTGEVLAELAEAGAQDADRAVAAARAAFTGPWRRMKPRQRQALLWALADAVDEHYEELRLLEVLDMGSPIGRPRKRTGPAWEAEVLRYFAGWATKIHGETDPEFHPGVGVQLHPEGTGGRGRRDRAVEPADQQRGLEDRAGAGDRMHAGAQARRGGEPRRRCGSASCAPRSALPDGVVNVVTGPGETRRCRADRAHGRRQGGLHRLHRHRAADHPRVGGQPQAPVAGARRQVARRGLRRRRPRQGGARRGDGRLLQLAGRSAAPAPGSTSSGRSTTTSSLVSRNSPTA